MSVEILHVESDNRTLTSAVIKTSGSIKLDQPSAVVIFQSGEAAMKILR